MAPPGGARHRAEGRADGEHHAGRPLTDDPEAAGRRARLGRVAHVEVHPVAVGHGVQDRRPHLVEAVPWRSSGAATDVRRGGRTRADREGGDASPGDRPSATA
ncbi:hypothetical protein ACGFY3_41570 [Streptomyces mirabilis]|uniref:hypothetical protein n=1 Tax=Streptomyces mirabilis TaxID=68239 RepID=UPI003722B5BB